MGIISFSSHTPPKEAQQIPVSQMGSLKLWEGNQCSHIEMWLNSLPAASGFTLSLNPASSPTTLHYADSYLRVEVTTPSGGPGPQ